MSPKFLIPVLALFATHALSQELPVAGKRMYSSPEGKLFVNKSLPLYILLTTDSTCKSFIALTRGNPANAAIPFFLSKEGLNIFKTPSAVDKTTGEVILPRQDVIFEAYADSRSPVTDMEIVNAKTINRNGKIFTQGKAAIQLKARDELSGVDKIMYSVDSRKFEQYSSPVQLENEKEYRIKYLSADNVGNLENINTAAIVVDNTKPKTTFEFKGDRSENIFSGNASIIFGSSDISSGVKSLSMFLDGIPVKNFSGIIGTRSLAQGEHKLEFFSTDNVNNQETKQEYVFFIDRTPPTILQDIIGKSFINNGKEYSSGHSYLKLTTLDNQAGVKEVYYSINKSSFKLYEKPVLLNTQQGKITIKAYALDKVNNRSEISDEASSFKFSYIDLTGPQLKYYLNGPVSESSDTIYISKKTKIKLLGYDTEAGFRNIEYSVDDKESVQYNGEFSITEEGYHTIGYTGYDNVENSSMDVIRVMADNTGPAVHIQFSTTPKGLLKENNKTLNAYPGHVCLFVAAVDNESGFDRMTYQLNGSPEKSFTGFLTGFKGINKISVKAYDRLGNFSSATVEFAIEK